MTQIQSCNLNTKSVSKVILGITFLTCGCAIYLLFRSKSLNIYQWCLFLGVSEMIDTLRYAVQDWRIPDIVIFSLPDGLYCAAYILIIDAIWDDNNRHIKFLIISLVPLVTITSELLQYFKLIRGTFDIYDLVCYVIPIIVFIGVQMYKNHRHNFKRITL